MWRRRLATARGSKREPHTSRIIWLCQRDKRGGGAMQRRREREKKRAKWQERWEEETLWKLQLERSDTGKIKWKIKETREKKCEGKRQTRRQERGNTDCAQGEKHSERQRSKSSLGKRKATKEVLEESKERVSEGQIHISSVSSHRVDLRPPSTLQSNTYSLRNASVNTHTRTDVISKSACRHPLCHNINQSCWCWCVEGFFFCTAELALGFLEQVESHSVLLLLPLIKRISCVEGKPSGTCYLWS